MTNGGRLTQLGRLGVVLAFAAFGVPVGCSHDKSVAAASTPDVDAGMEASIPRTFPTGFLWGAATAPFQVEGGLVNTDWYAWQKEMGRVANGDLAENGPQEVANYEQDLVLAKQLGLTIYRLGFDFSRVFPTQAAFQSLTPDPAAVALYHAVVRSARDKGMKIMLTLHHFANPIWLSDYRAGQPPFNTPAVGDALAGWAGWAAREYGSEVDYWLTINEPTLYLAFCYVTGAFPPGKSGDLTGFKNAHQNAALAHGKMYDAIKAVNASYQVGFNFVVIPSFPSRGAQNTDDVAAAQQFHYALVEAMPNAIVKGDLDADFDQKLTGANDVQGDPRLKGKADWLGIDYYTTATIEGPSLPVIGGIPQDNPNDGLPREDLGRPIYPEGMATEIPLIAAYGKPIFITENGVPDQKDVIRPRALVQHLKQLEALVQKGLDIRGYIHWALIDNMEWERGFCPRFGLTQIDFASPSKTRTPRPSAQVYARIISEGRVAPDLDTQFPSYGAPTICP